MLKAPETTKTTPPQAVTTPAPCGPGKTADSPTIICDLADADAFVEACRRPHVPVMSSFGAGRLHVCRLYGSFDLDKAASENADALFRSIRWIHAPHAKANNEYWDDLTFQLGRRSYVYLDKDRIIGFATTPGEAGGSAKRFAKAYRQPPVKAGVGGDFNCESALRPHRAVKPLIEISRLGIAEILRRIREDEIRERLPVQQIARSGKDIIAAAHAIKRHLKTAVHESKTKQSASRRRHGE